MKEEVEGEREREREREKLKEERRRRRRRRERVRIMYIWDTEALHSIIFHSTPLYSIVLYTPSFSISLLLLSLHALLPCVDFYRSSTSTTNSSSTSTSIHTNRPYYILYSLLLFSFRIHYSFCINIT